MNRGLPVLDKARALDSCHRPEGSWALGTRMRRLDDVLTTSHMRRTLARENFTSAPRRRASSLSMLKVPNDRQTLHEISHRVNGFGDLN